MIFTHRCAECSCMVLIGPGTCGNCIRHMTEAGTRKEPEPKFTSYEFDTAVYDSAAYISGRSESIQQVINKINTRKKQ